MVNALVVIGVLVVVVLGCGLAGVLVALALSKPDDDYKHKL